MSQAPTNWAACVFYPSNAQEVSIAVQELNKHPAVGFALKCGGHSPNLVFSSVDEGVLILFRPNSQYAYPSDDEETVDVGAGAR